MLIGEHAHTFDEKSRISLPAKFRKEIGSTVVIAPGIDGCLFVFTTKSWKEFTDRLSRPDSSSVLQADNRNFNRLIIGRAVETSIDSIGRVLIPDHLRAHAGLKTEAIIIGVINRVEIWDATRWKHYRTSFEKKTDVMAEKLNSAGIF
ncbi:MAG: division/cell wall cluster transcriptional repressor MraZ [Candidatus Taylorbacteria bacterium RIFCSPHIGHO2_01_FULL_46_22b]|uniref:Transcriptional regulator MraZ n=1 Tax=Candidatus Taylorbacteria bacterium RIFCSPHIGHO2_01_FULL_46_22b TaxID=1802301 RepID=A0A1G2M3T2_9BACT|nr:MAG: division/cell wall cluster transcriptional repressor MraZ [Candidatus Taylorbacteria bacterium RIFCSPHIGHO2_01_FULL_46_22b]